MVDRRQIERQRAGSGRRAAHQQAATSMAEASDTSGRGRYLTVGWNNALAAGLGLLMVAFAAVTLTSRTFSDRASFIAIVAIGAVY